MSRSSIKASTAALRSRPRSRSRTRTSESSNGRPSTTARMRSTTLPCAAPVAASSPASADAAALERMPDGEVHVVGLLARAAVQLVAPVDAQRPERALVAQAQARGIAQVAERDLGDQRVDVARLREGGGGEPAPRVVAQLRPAQQEAAAPGGHALPGGRAHQGAHAVQAEAAHA